MTRVKIQREAGHIQSVKSSGHCDFAASGEDIVCAALSSVLQTALLGLMGVAGLDVNYHRDDEEGYLEFSIASNLGEKDRFAADMILETMVAGVSDLYESFSKYISLKIVEK
jgi:uncharacterized protein YsxB (DUF464 family)